MTIPVGKSPLEANRNSASQEILRILYKPKVYFRIHKSIHWFLFRARWIQSTPSHPTLLKIHSNSILTSNLSLTFKFSDQNYTRTSRLFHTCYTPRPT